MSDLPARPQSSVSRRGLLKAAGLLTLALTACRPNPAKSAEQLRGNIGPEEGGRVPESQELFPPSAEEATPGDSFQVFTPHEAKTVEALTARILPGDKNDPGAREAGVVHYIDTMLAFHEGFNEVTYRKAPYAQTYRGARPADEPGVIWVPADQIYRYGYQSILTPREVYRLGVAGVDRLSHKRFKQDVIDLSEAQQDALIGLMAGGKAGRFDRNLTAESFFHNLRRHTAEGMFSDPGYGGNRDLVGYKLVGFPGSQRAYTPREYQTEGTKRVPQSLAQMHAFNPGRQSSDLVTLPVSGEDMQHKH